MTDYALKTGTVVRSPRSAYKIERTLGAGGFGITYLASTQVMFGNLPITVKVAIKEHFVSSLCERDSDSSTVKFSNPVADQVERLRRDFLAEASRLNKADIQHPNIVKVNEVFEANNTAYYVMEYLDGITLADYVKQRGPLPEREALDLLRGIFGGVAHLHANSMTHLDIKPQNIMLVADDQGRGRQVLIDFGLAKHYDKEGNPTSSLNVPAVSHGYSPMEQYAGITSFSPRADIYALGATLLFCLTGKVPPKAVDIDLAAVLAPLRGSVSTATLKAVANAMQSRAFDRIPTVAAFVSDLHSGAAPSHPDGIGAEPSRPDEGTPTVLAPKPGQGADAIRGERAKPENPDYIQRFYNLPRRTQGRIVRWAIIASAAYLVITALLTINHI